MNLFKHVIFNESLHFNQKWDWSRFREVFESINLVMYFINLALQEGCLTCMKQIRLFPSFFSQKFSILMFHF